jgi:hypothetical protein
MRAMPPLRALAALTGLCALALPACAPRVSVPWPPRAGSCIEAARKGHYKGAPWRYWIEGSPATREEVERKVYDTPDLQKSGRRHAVVSVAGPVLFATGGPTMIGGLFAAGLSHNPLLLLISAAGLAMAATGFTLGVTDDDPFRGAVVAYNEAAARKGLCGAREPSPPPEPWRQPPEVLPTLPSRGWVP